MRTLLLVLSLFATTEAFAPQGWSRSVPTALQKKKHGADTRIIKVEAPPKVLPVVEPIPLESIKEEAAEAPSEIVESVIEEPAEVPEEAPKEEVAIEKPKSAQQLRDESFLREAINLVEESEDDAFPQPTVGAVWVSADGTILGKGRSNYERDAVQAVVSNAGLKATALTEWCVALLPESMRGSTLYLTLEPSAERRGSALPPITELIAQIGVARVVIGCGDPVPELSLKGAAALHAEGIEVVLGTVFREECAELISSYAEMANSKLQRMARKHFELFDRPLGFLHCSVVDSDNLEAFARHGNAFGTNFGGTNLSYRKFGAYEIAPPPEVVWADDSEDGDFDDLYIDFDEEPEQDRLASSSPMMPWYEQVDAVVATFPKPGNGPADDDSLAARLNGLKWLATHGSALPAGVERILVMDATDLSELPLENSHPDMKNVDIETFWKGKDRKPTRVLLRRGTDVQARAAAEAAALAAKAAAFAAEQAAAAIESGDAILAAEAAVEYQQAALDAAHTIQKELQLAQALRRKLEDQGVIVELLEGNDPIDVMRHLGKRNGLHTVVWRAGCWGQRGVESIMAGAFQWVSAHLAVDAIGGRFWQLMLAENAVQAACGPQRRVKVFADPDDLSLEYCDEPDADSDCALSIEGRPVRHIRLDCRVGLVDGSRPREFVNVKTKKLDRKIIEEEAPWFL